MTALACRRSAIEGRVKVTWNCSAVVICTWFVSILCPLLSLLCHIANNINTGPVANSFICSLLDKLLGVFEHFFRRYKLNHLQILHSLYLWKQRIIIIGNTIIVIMITIITFTLHENLKGVVITLHHKSHLLWEWLLSWKRLSWGTEVERKGNCPYSMDEWNEWSPEEPFREKRDITSVKYSSLSWEGQRNDF